MIAGQKLKGLNEHKPATTLHGVDHTAEWSATEILVAPDSSSPRTKNYCLHRPVAIDGYIPRKTQQRLTILPP